MCKPTQGADAAIRQSFLVRAVVLAAVIALGQGCAGPISAKSAPDLGLTTASITERNVAFEGDESLLSDGRAILTALSATDLSGNAALPWENEDSGARGLITAYGAEQRDGRECLAFTTTRENFDGIGLYRGTACEDAAGVLRLYDFSSL